MCLDPNTVAAAVIPICCAAVVIVYIIWGDKT